MKNNTSKFDFSDSLFIHSLMVLSLPHRVLILATKKRNCATIDKLGRFLIIGNEFGIIPCFAL